MREVVDTVMTGTALSNPIYYGLRNGLRSDSLTLEEERRVIGQAFCDKILEYIEAGY